MEMTTKKSSRITAIDCVRGIGMLLVILELTTESHVLKAFVYSFHMPFFSFALELP